ncbi:MAG: transglycosylase SLT domain-containing protein [Lewinellaceae bacterium]|nr:transglycosylase SLT domain-containing protein [Lewinellaceae bacterium]
MLKGWHTYTALVAAACTIALLTSYVSSGGSADSGNTANSRAATDQLPQRIRPVNLNRPFTFAGESLPMDNFDVRERLERELLATAYQHSSTLLAMQRTTRFFPYFEKALNRYNIPVDFKYLAVAESTLSNAVSPAGARGLWQLMKTVAEFYGLEISADVDERYHPEKSTEAACKYLKHLQGRFGSWTLAAAAYNLGETKLARDLSEQRGTSYFDLNLNEETSRYVFRLFAIKAILDKPADFGFDLQETQPYITLDKYRVVNVDYSIENLGDFAQQQGIPYRMLKVYNPWLISSRLPRREGKIYEIRIPE